MCKVKGECKMTLLNCFKFSTIGWYHIMCAQEGSFLLCFLGCILMKYILFFQSETEQGVAQAIIRSVIDFKRDPWPKVSDNAKDLVKKMLDPDPRRRLTAQEVLGNVLLHKLNVFHKCWDLFINIKQLTKCCHLQIILGYKMPRRLQMLTWVRLWEQGSNNFRWWTSSKKEL